MKNNDKRIIVVIDGPSGVGKDTIILKLIEKFPDVFVKAQSTTTREMRPGESQGNPYFFVSEEEFLNSLKNGDMFEHTTRHGTYRGMSKYIFDNILNSGKIPVKDCDYIGLNALRKLYPGRVLGIFLTAPKEEIIDRLIARNKDDKTIDARIADYDEFVKTKKYFDCDIENIDIDKAVDEILKTIEKFNGSKIH